MADTSAFVVDRIPQEKKKSNRRTARLIVMGNSVRCPMCSHELFWERKVLLNSRAATFFGFDWANKGSRAMVCDDCGHILFFAND